MNEVFYVRNTRPNAVLIRHKDSSGTTIKFTVERRGSREDTISLPGELRTDPTVASFLNRGILEEISKDAFMHLDARGTGRPAFALRRSASEVNLPHSGEESRTPFVMADKTIDDSKFLRSPQPEFAERVPTTAEEMATGVRQPLPEEKKVSSIANTKEEKLEGQVQDLSAQVQALAALLEKSLTAQAEAQANVIEVAEAQEAVEPKPARKTSSSATKNVRAKKRS